MTSLVGPLLGRQHWPGPARNGAKRCQWLLAIKLRLEDRTRRQGSSRASSCRRGRARQAVREPRAEDLPDHHHPEDYSYGLGRHDHELDARHRPGVPGRFQQLVRRGRTDRHLHALGYDDRYQRRPARRFDQPSTRRLLRNRRSARDLSKQRSPEGRRDEAGVHP